MTYSEYRIVGFDSWDHGAARRLSELGQEGWNVLNVTEQRYATKVLLERPVHIVVPVENV